MDIQAAKKRCEAATRERWGVGTGLAYNVCSQLPDTEAQSIVCENIDSYADADFIAHARSDLPAAVKALEAIRLKAEDWGSLDARGHPVYHGAFVTAAKEILAILGERE